MEYVTGGGQNASVSATTMMFAPERLQANLLEANKGKVPHVNDLFSIDEEEKSEPSSEVSEVNKAVEVSEVSEAAEVNEDSTPSDVKEVSEESKASEAKQVSDTQ